MNLLRGSEWVSWFWGGPWGRGSSSHSRKGGLDGQGKGLARPIMWGHSTGQGVPSAMRGALASLLAPVSPQAPSLAAQRRALLAPALGFSWQDPPWRLFLLDEASP